MNIFLPSSLETIKAQQKIRDIYKPESEQYFNNFMRTELTTLRQKDNVNEIIKYIEDKKSNVYKFAKILSKNSKLIADLKEAIRLQANSAGTKQKGLFYTRIYQKINNADLSITPGETNQSLERIKNEVKIFLLAKKQDPDNNSAKTETKTKSETSKEPTSRMKFEDMRAKLKSIRRSNVIKVFIAMVLWDYIIIAKKKEEEYKEQIVERKKQLAERGKQLEKLKSGLMPLIEKFIEYRQKFDEYQSAKKHLLDSLGIKVNPEKFEIIYPDVSSAVIVKHCIIPFYNSLLGNTDVEENFSLDKFKTVWTKPIDSADIPSLLSSSPFLIRTLKGMDENDKSEQIKLFSKGITQLDELTKNIKESSEKSGDALIEHLKSKAAYDKHYYIIEDFSKFIGIIVMEQEKRKGTLFSRFKFETEKEKEDFESWLETLYDVRARLPEAISKIIKNYPQGRKFIDAYNFLADVNKSFDYEIMDEETYIQYLSELKSKFENIDGRNKFELKKMSGYVCEVISRRLKYAKGLEKISSPDSAEIDKIAANPPKDMWHDDRYVPIDTESIYSKAAGGKVYIYWDKQEKKKVILKWLFGTMKEERKKKFLNLKSKYLPKIHKFTEKTSKGEGMIMDYIEGNIRVETYMLSIRNNPKEILRIVRENTEAVIDLISAGFDTPESKAEHFLVDKDHHVKLIDFDANNSSPDIWFHDRTECDICDYCGIECEDLKSKIMEMIKDESKLKTKRDFEKILKEIEKLEKYYSNRKEKENDLTAAETARIGVEDLTADGTPTDEEQRKKDEETKKKAEEERKRQEEAQRKAAEEEQLEQFLYNKENNFMPSPGDIVQDEYLNNCYMLGVLISLAEKNPHFIKNELIKLKGKNIVVSLYDYKNETIYTYEEKDKTKKYVYPLNKHEYILSVSDIEESEICKFGKHKSKWVFAVEIAFAKLLRDDHVGNEFKPTDNLRDILRDHKDEPSVATTVLTGRRSKLNIMPPFDDRKKTQQPEPIKKFPEGAKYNDYCMKIRNSLLKHLKQSGLIVAAFDNLSSPYISPKKVYKMIKENPELLTEDKTIKNLLCTGHTDMSKYCIWFMESDEPFCKSYLYQHELYCTVVPYLNEHIDEPNFKKFKDLSINFDSNLYKILLDNPEPLKPSGEPWEEEFKKEEELEIFMELMTIDKEDFTKSKFFDWVLEGEAAPYLSENLKRPEYKELRKRTGLVSNHAYAVLNCFEDEETKYWYVTLQNAWGKETKIDYSKSDRTKRLGIVKFPPEPKPGVINVFNMELADFCKYLKGYSYDKPE